MSIYKISIDKWEDCERLEWTTEPPKEPGWYWVHVKDKYRAVWAGREEIIYVTVHNSKLLYKLQDTYIIAHWLGPLPIPDPPEK